MSQVFTEFTRQGYVGRIGRSIRAVVIGLVFLVAAPVLLFWNEGRAVRTAKMLQEAGNLVVTIDPGRIDPARDGKLVHFTAEAKGDTLADPLFHVSRDAVRLKRTAEMYQWKQTVESRSKTDGIGGGSTTSKTYTYERVWSDKPIDSSQFHIPGGHENPAAWRVESSAWTPPHVKAGAFTLPPQLVSRIDNFEPVPLTDAERAQLPETMQKDATIAGGKCYVAGDPGHPADPQNPKIGDVRVSLAAAPPGPVSVIGEQTGGSVAAYTTPSGGPIELLYVGAHPAKEMIATEQQRNAALTWLIRAVGFVLMWIAIFLVLQPLKIVASVVGVLGDLVGVGVGLVALLGAATFSAAIIATAWLVYRPLLGGCLLVVAAAAATGLFVLWQRRAATRRAAATMPLPGINPMPQRH